MRAIRRVLQVVTFVGTLMVGVLALALIASQTPWFRDWLRRYIVRESKQYLNGQLTIGGLHGNLLFGVDLDDVAVDVSGERVIAVKGLQLDYSVFTLLSRGLTLDQIKIDQPVLRLERDANGWNLARLVKREEPEANQQGPMRPVSLPSIEVSDASVAIEDRNPTSVSLPRRIDDIDLKAQFEYETVHYSVTLDHLSLHGSSPNVSVRDLTGKLAVRDDDLYVDNVTLNTRETSITMNGVIENYLATPVVKVTTTGNVSLPEIGRLVPAAAGYNLHPAIDLKADGPAERLGLNLNIRSEAGNVGGRIVADVQGPDFSARGDLDVERLNLAPILKDPAQRTDLTGHAKLDLAMKSSPASTSAADRVRGTFVFNSPHVVATGYDASGVKLTAGIAGSRISLDGRAAAYGGTATARGFIVTPGPGRAFAFDLRGTANGVNLRNLPSSLGVPRAATNFSASEYHVAGEGASIRGTATLNESTIEGATFASGTSAEFAVTPATISYSARGRVANLDLHRLGVGLNVDALVKPAYDSRINGSFDVAGSSPRTPPRRQPGSETPPSAVSAMKLDASSTLNDSELMGGKLPELSFEAHLDHGALAGRANGRFEGFNPGELAGRKELDGAATGTVDANFSIRDVSAPVTPDAISADGRATLASSTIGGLKIDSAELEGKYTDQAGDLTKLEIVGPDLKANASGRVSLDRNTSSNLKYHVEANNLPELAKLAGQSNVGGVATLDGSLTGNAASLSTTGKLNGSNLSYGDNNALNLNSQYEVTVPDLQFANASVQATTDATFVKVGGMEINSVNATTKYGDKTLDFTTNVKEQTRELDASGKVIFHPDYQEIQHPSLAFRTQGVEWRTAPGSEATVQYRRERLDLENVRIVNADQSIDVNGTLALGEGTSTGAIKVKASNVDLKQLEALAQQDRGLSGKLNADATIAGTTSAPEVKGTVQITGGGFQSYNYDSLVANVDYQGTRLGLDATLQQSATESITAKGSVPTTLFKPSASGQHVEPSPGDAIDLQIKASAISLAMVQGLTNQITNVAGTLEADVRVTGSGEDPHAQGFVDIKNGAFSVPAAGETFTGLTARIELTPDALQVREFQLLDRHRQPLRVSGELAVHARQVGGVNVSIESDNLEVLRNQLGDVQVQTALKLTGQLRRPQLVGDIRLDAARIQADQVLALFNTPYTQQSLPEVVSAEQTVQGSGSAEEATQKALAKAGESAPPGAEQKAAEEQNETPAPSGPFAALSMDVHLVARDNLVVRANDLRPGGPTGAALGDLNITLGGDLRVRKSPDAPIVLVGVVNTVRGTYDFQSRRFNLVRDGTIRFTGTPQINPLLDIRATRLIPNTGVEARIHITGTPTAPQLSLTSDPPLEESDILALIIFNRPVNELGTGERTSLAATAGGIATGFIAAPLGQSIGKALDVDLFEIVPTTSESGELGAAITLGQQVNERTFIKLHQEFGQRSTTEFRLEYRIARFLRLETSLAPETTGAANRLNQRRVEREGIDLIFFFSY